MRDYFSQPNFFRAASLSAVVTALSIGRILQGRGLLTVSPSVAVAACFLSMTLVCGVVTAWGRKARMPGIVTDRKTFLRGMAVALLAAIVALPVYRYLLDPLYHGLYSEAGNEGALAMSYPSSLAGQLALMGWIAGFQVLFACAAPMSLMARLTGRRNLAILLTLAVNAHLIHLKVVEHGMQEHLLVFAVPSLVSSALACFVFSRFGLVPTVLMAGGMTLHFFLPAVG